MSAIYGLVRLDGGPVGARELAAMAGPMAYWGPDGGGTWSEGSGGLGQLVLATTPEAAHERGPVEVLGGEAVVTAAARLDNREDLCHELRLDRDTADGAIVAAAYERWGEGAVRRLFGDWSFAAWHARERRLVLARDHYGQTALYHHFDGATFAFASSLKGLLALPHVPRGLDELRLAQWLAAWVVDATNTLHEGVRRLPPAHVLVVSPEGARTREYWHPDEVPEVRLASDAEYVERFLELFSAAVRTRLRSTGGVASTLSAGLDSGAVTALAAHASGGPELTALTAVPAYREAAAARPGDLVDEWPLAAFVAARCPGIDHVAVDGRDAPPIAAVERSLDVHEELAWAMASLPWIFALLERCRDGGARVLLSGQMGNGGVSWAGGRDRALGKLLAGDVRGAAGNLAAQRRAGAGWPTAVRRELAGPLRRRISGELRRRRALAGETVVGPLVAPAFARRLDLANRMRDSGHDHTHVRSAGREFRLAVLLPGVNAVGSLWHEKGAAYGIDVRDPTADVRLLEFCLGVPEEQWSRGDTDRRLMRVAMAGLLPDEVRWNRRRGRQSADAAFRLRTHADEMDRALEQITASRAASSYLAIDALRVQWAAIRAEPRALALGEVNTLMRGVAAGLWLVRQEGGGGKQHGKLPS